MLPHLPTPHSLILCHSATVVAVWKEVEKLAVAVGNFKGCFPLPR
ncbi:hypothetical protein COO91_03212 [Nostoc flagelliforme CCNUN1]|uniref:Uncharacterized protein n=1 Tax=Nostoc flagelliforme CCNUN1 TaxID=2038116 RepID=A0A2K8SP71_9NOSO|nr:hypothetical protein COO91_03212 [Nostoc flagelliforme CCNUN1]